MSADRADGIPVLRVIRIGRERGMSPYLVRQIERTREVLADTSYAGWTREDRYAFRTGQLEATLRSLLDEITRDEITGDEITRDEITREWLS